MTRGPVGDVAAPYLAAGDKGAVNDRGDSSGASKGDSGGKGGVWGKGVHGRVRIKMQRPRVANCDGLRVCGAAPAFFSIYSDVFTCSLPRWHGLLEHREFHI